MKKADFRVFFGGVFWQESDHLGVTGMSTGTVYQALELGAYEVLGVEEDADEVLILVAWPREKWPRRACGSRRVHCHDWKTRLWRPAPVGLNATRVAMDVPRLSCLQCGVISRRSRAVRFGTRWRSSGTRRSC